MNEPPDPSCRRDIYPEIKPFDSGNITLDSPHQMYWEVSGNPDGVPVLFLHGGPGAGASAEHRRFFDPGFYRIVIYDQRGAGRSSPIGETHNNTTGHLIADIETLREHLQISRWCLFGGSWGSTLALAYAQAHPERCTALVLRGIFLSGEDEIDWFLYGMRKFFPEAWQAFVSPIPEEERHDLLRAYRRRLDDPDPETRISAARRWSVYEGSCSSLLPERATVEHFADERVALGLARIEAHYFANASFLEPGQLLSGIHRMRHLPGFIIQGRYDMVCPIRTANALHEAWPEARYVIVPDAGHSAWEPGISAQLVAAMEQLKSTLAPVR